VRRIVGKFVIACTGLGPRVEKTEGLYYKGRDARSNGARGKELDVSSRLPKMLTRVQVGGGVVGDAMAARLDEGRRRGGRKVMQKGYIGRASGSVGSKKEVVHKPRRRTDCKCLDRGVEARGENNGGYLRSGCGCRSGERGLTSKTTP
jgi:hypothetical protein